MYKITDYDQTAKDIEKYRTDQVAQLCEKGDMCITMPYLPYGAKGPSAGT